jgi:hypothetical protein
MSVANRAVTVRERFLAARKPLADARGSVKGESVNHGR